MERCQPVDHRSTPALALVLAAVLFAIAGCGRSTPGAVPAAGRADSTAVVPASATKATVPADGWTGVYSFDEAWETEGQDIKNIITYELDVAQRGDSLLAEFNADGYMTSIHAHCTTIADDRHLVVLFKEAGEDNMFNQAGEGDTLFTLVRRGDSLLTYWGVMAPQATELEDGTPYFKKDRTP